MGECSDPKIGDKSEVDFRKSFDSKELRRLTCPRFVPDLSLTLLGGIPKSFGSKGLR